MAGFGERGMLGRGFYMGSTLTIQTKMPKMVPVILYLIWDIELRARRISLILPALPSLFFSRPVLP